MDWRTRRRGSKKQKGTHFLVKRKTSSYFKLKTERKKSLRILKIKPESNVYKRLKRQTPKVLNYNGREITLRFDGKTLHNKIKIVPHERMVGNWSRTSNTIFIDNDLTPYKWRKSIAIHETLEKYFKEEYNLNENAEGHELAEEIEAKWARKHMGQRELDDYSKIVERIHRKELLR